MPDHDNRFFTKRFGPEAFSDGDTSLSYSMNDFWSWSYSNIMFNTIRGDLGEFIIYKALEGELSNKHYSLRRDGDVCDFQIDDICIEVKTASYIQAWEQNDKPYSDINFDIARREDYDFNTGKPIKGSKKRWANIYVFCLLNEKNRDLVNPLDISQWKFWVVSTSEITRVRKDKEKLPIGQLESVNPIESNHADLLHNIKETYNKYIGQPYS